MSLKKVAIVGLGLMGGSLSLGLKKSSKDYYFIGLDHNELHCSTALKLGLVDEITHSMEVLRSCDIIILAIPVDAIVNIISQLQPLAKNCTIIELGSTKEKITLSIPPSIRQNIVTAHPMTGTEKFGPHAAIDNLYTSKVLVLCDFEKAGTYQKEVAKQIFSKLQMSLVFMTSKEHDKHAAFISHMPHLLSFSLANSVMKQEEKESILALAGGGFKDMSRIAKSSPNMWENIFRQNKDNVLTSIHALQSELKKCEKMIEYEEWDALNKWMKKANSLHDII